MKRVKRVIGKMSIVEVQSQILQENLKNLTKYLDLIKKNGGTEGFSIVFSPNMVIGNESFVVGCQLAYVHPDDIHRPSDLVKALNRHLHDDDEESPRWVKCQIVNNEIEFFYE